MVLHLAGRGGVVVSQDLQRRIATKIDKMARLVPKLLEARVVLATERHRRVAEVTLRAKRATFHVEGEAATFPAAVEQALDALSSQIRRRKERVTAKKPRPSRAGPARRRSTPVAPEPAEPAPPVRVRRTDAKPMSIEEAVDQLRLQADGLLVFRNARTRSVNVLRRRSDGAVELVEPAG